jgi:hypothetical protein
LVSSSPAARLFGEDVVIGHQFTIGNRNGAMRAPTIGNRVYLGAGSKILGPVQIGDEAITGMDRQDVHASSPVQASFSIWRTSPNSLRFVTRWLNLCSQRPLISDDANFENALNFLTSGLTVTTKRYSLFAAWKIGFQVLISV